MVRFRVIKASRLLLGAAVVALALMVCLLALRMFSASGESTPAGGASQQGAEAALAAFAAPAQNAQIEITVLEPSASGQASCASASPCASPTSCASASPSPTPAPAAVRVLIYHTHTHEAYEQGRRSSLRGRRGLAHRGRGAQRRARGRGIGSPFAPLRP